MRTAELRQLLAEATPGPWETRVVREPYTDPTPALVVPSRGGHDPWWSLLFSDNADEDAALIVAAVNALPALLDVAKAAQEWRARPGHLGVEIELEAALAALEKA